MILSVDGALCKSIARGCLGSRTDIGERVQPLPSKHVLTLQTLCSRVSCTFCFSDARLARKRVQASSISCSIHSYYHKTISSHISEHTQSSAIHHREDEVQLEICILYSNYFGLIGSNLLRNISCALVSVNLAFANLFSVSNRLR